MHLAFSLQNGTPLTKFFFSLGYSNLKCDVKLLQKLHHLSLQRLLKMILQLELKYVHFLGDGYISTKKIGSLANGHSN